MKWFCDTIPHMLIGACGHSRDHCTGTIPGVPSHRQTHAYRRAGRHEGNKWADRRDIYLVESAAVPSHYPCYHQQRIRKWRDLVEVCGPNLGGFARSVQPHLYNGQLLIMAISKSQKGVSAWWALLVLPGQDWPRSTYVRCLRVVRRSSVGIRRSRVNLPF